MKTKPSIQMFISALLLICVCNFANGQSLLLPVPGSATSDGPTGYIDFTDPANPQFVEFPAHYFEYINNPGFPGNPHIEEHLANSDVSMSEKYLGQHPMYAQSVVHDADGIRNWNPDDWNARGGIVYINLENHCYNSSK